MGSMNTKHKTNLVGHRVTVAPPRASPTRQLTSVTLPRQTDNVMRTTIPRSYAESSMEPHSLVTRLSHHGRSGRRTASRKARSAKPRQSLRKSTLHAVPILIWRRRLQLAATATTDSF